MKHIILTGGGTAGHVTPDMYLESTELKGAAVSRAKMKI
jgi:UDP-N-acetylglucosamine:LPS N-acetylglucosamine transferase